MSEASKAYDSSILIVDDTYANQILLMEMLKREGYVVSVTPNGQTALRAAFSAPPDLILLDIMMPGIDGYGVCQRLKADARTRDVPVIFLSARTDPEDKVRAFEVGGADYITKPFQVSEVLARVSVQLALRGLQQQLQTHNARLAQELDERQRIEAHLRDYAERLKIMHEITQSIVAARSPETIAVAATGRIRQLMACQRVVILALTEAGHLKPLAADSSGAVALGIAPESYREVFQLPALRAGRIHGVPDVAAIPQPTLWYQTLQVAGVRSCVIIPLLVHGELMGTLHLESVTPHYFNAGHIGAASEVAAPLAVAIHQARLYETAQQEIAERKLAEEALRQQTLELEARNADLDAFAHTVAHDLKTPLSVLVGFSYLLLKRYAQMEMPVIQANLEAIARSARKMTTIINELLFLSSVRKMEDVPQEPLDMAAIVTEACERMAEHVRNRKAQLDCPAVWPRALGYAAWVEEIWVNYISNAIKYGGDPPCVTLGAERLPGGQVRLWVRDNGPGLSESEQAQLFTDFTRLDQARGEGHGLGLSIVRRIADKLQGTVGVESELGAGCTFWFVLPGAPDDEGA